jgi:hypothetical protein
MPPILKIRQPVEIGSIRSRIQAGGYKIPAGQFVRAINASFHVTEDAPDGEAFIDLNHIDSPMGSISEVQESNGKLIHGNHEFYMVSDSKAKWDIVYTDAASVPPIERFRVRYSNNLTFYRQTRADIEANGGELLTREAEDSFAVYFNDGTVNNKYQTGKVMHLYSPYYVDEGGAESPLVTMTLSPDVDNAKMLILSHSPEVTAWLNDPARVGKIRLDPVIGYDTVGASTFQKGGSAAYRGGWQASENGTVVSFHQAAVVLLDAPCKIAVVNADQTSPYNVDGKTIVAHAEDTQTSSSDNFVFGNLVSNEDIVAGTWYRIGHVTSNSGPDFKLKGDLGVSRTLNFRTGVTYTNEFIDPTPSTSKAAQGLFLSHWAVYEEAVSAVIPPHLFQRGR